MNRKKWRRTILILAVVLPIGLYLWFFGFQSVMICETRYAYRNMPTARTIPVELSDRSVSMNSGTKLRCFDYEFEVPWQDVDIADIQRKTMTLVPFRSGLNILVGHGSTQSLIDGLVQRTKMTREQLRASYGAGVIESDYDFLNLALNATPSQVRLTESKQQAMRTSMLLIIKTAIAQGDSGIFKVGTSEFHGFQYGDPNKHPRAVTVTLYSADGNVEFIFAGRLPLTDVSQADINRVIQTVRHLPSAAN